jgi:hypothetical protein
MTLGSVDAPFPFAPLQLAAASRAMAFHGSAIEKMAPALHLLLKPEELKRKQKERQTAPSEQATPTLSRRH